MSVTGARPDTSFARDVFRAGRSRSSNCRTPTSCRPRKASSVKFATGRNPKGFFRANTLSARDYTSTPTSARCSSCARSRPLITRSTSPGRDTPTSIARMGLDSSVYTGRAVKHFPGLACGSASRSSTSASPKRFIHDHWLDASGRHPSWSPAIRLGDESRPFALNVPSAERRRSSRRHGVSRLVRTPLPFYEGRLNAELSARAPTFESFGADATPGNPPPPFTRPQPLRNGLLTLALIEERNRTET